MSNDCVIGYTFGVYHSDREARRHTISPFSRKKSLDRFLLSARFITHVFRGRQAATDQAIEPSRIVGS